MQANRLGDCPSDSFFTLLIFLQCNDNDFGGNVVTRDVLYETEKTRHTKRNEKIIVGSECIVFWHDQL